VTHLTRVLWQSTHASPIDVTGAEVLMKPGGVQGFAGSFVPENSILKYKEYEAWLEEFEGPVLGAMPALEMIAAARVMTQRSVREEHARSAVRVAATYDALIGMTLTTKQYAETVTSNAQYIALANKVLESANAALGKLAPTAAVSETANAQEGTTNAP